MSNLADHEREQAAITAEWEARNTKPTIPAAWLPNAAVPVTIIHTHPDYDPGCEVIMAARDWESRGAGYLAKLADLEPGTRILASFDGRLTSKAGDAINGYLTLKEPAP